MQREQTGGTLTSRRSSDQPAYVVTSKNGTVCLEASFNLGISVEYESVANGPKEWTLGNFTNLNNGTLKRDSVFCNENQALVVQNFLHDWILVLQFAKSCGSSSIAGAFRLDFVQLNFTLHDPPFNGANDSRVHYAQNYQVAKFSTPLGQTFHSSQESLNMTINNATTPNVRSITIGFTDLTIRAFINETCDVPPCEPGTENCRPGDVESAVVIWLGVALGVMCVAVVLAFLFGRRRFRFLEPSEPDYGSMREH